MPAIESELTREHSQSVATIVRGELARRRMSRQALADKARISISTLEKALAGRRPFTLATTIRLEEALGRSLGSDSAPAGPPPTALAPESLGAYSRAAAAWLTGEYLTVRPSLEYPQAIFAYRTDIAWDEAASHLVFREKARLDAAFTQKGSVSLPNQSGQIYLITNESGQFRLAILNRPTIEGELYGLLTTLQVGLGGHLTPASLPLALIPMRHAPAVAPGRIQPGDAAYPACRERLERITRQGFARFLPVA
ncbi:helix-turn-helix domain-containing protein [Phreatobacter stygius]|uniref:Helix-turn-helix transcriptional regulator n=1 Tax=Phreatobacter stygius TaxID=1940610 RepID=A0A4D7B7Y9_9HYPH|nr:helix-turn-helix transcriptional regulator [Phreatobacter stygius]QCI66438.1 helix-turn-helix transcriptional regulator [Phreatobacter stygius]